MPHISVLCRFANVCANAMRDVGRRRNRKELATPLSVFSSCNRLPGAEADRKRNKTTQSSDPGGSTLHVFLHNFLASFSASRGVMVSTTF